jgi:hypothetical protein
MSSFDKYSFGDRERRSGKRSASSFGSFDDWYEQFAALRTQWKTDKQRIKREIKDEWQREREEWRKEYRRASGGRPPAQLMGDAVRTLMTIVDDAVNSSRQRKSLSPAEQMRLDQQRRHEEEYYRLMRKIESTERRLEKKRRGFKVHSVLTAVFGLGFVFDSDLAALPVIFGGLAALNLWTTRDIEAKLNRLYVEREQLGALPPARGYSAEMEKTILRHAFEREGKVYPELLVVNSDLTLQEVEYVLKECVDKRLASIELDEKGRTYYYFASFDQSDPYANLSGTPT